MFAVRPQCGKSFEQGSGIWEEPPLGPRAAVAAPAAFPWDHHCHTTTGVSHRRWRSSKIHPRCPAAGLCHQHQGAVDLVTVNAGLCYPLPLIKTTSESKKKDEVWVQGGERKRQTQ